MMRTTHIAGGFTAGTAACIPLPAMHGATAVLFAAVAAVAAPWPDLDNFGTWSRTRPGVFFDWHIHPVKYRISRALAPLGRHREGPAHSLAGAAAAGAVLTTPMMAWAWWPWWAGLAAFVGLVSHLLLDLMTLSPVRVLWPAGWLIHGLPRGLRVRVGGGGEVLVLVLLVAAAVKTTLLALG